MSDIADDLDRFHAAKHRAVLAMAGLESLAYRGCLTKEEMALAASIADLVTGLRAAAEARLDRRARALSSNTSPNVSALTGRIA